MTFFFYAEISQNWYFFPLLPPGMKTVVAQDTLKFTTTVATTHEWIYVEVNPQVQWWKCEKPFKIMWISLSNLELVTVSTVLIPWNKDGTRPHRHTGSAGSHFPGMEKSVTHAFGLSELDLFPLQPGWVQIAAGDMGSLQWLWIRLCRNAAFH